MSSSVWVSCQRNGEKSRNRAVESIIHNVSELALYKSCNYSGVIMGELQGGITLLKSNILNLINILLLHSSN